MELLKHFISVNSHMRQQCEDYQPVAHLITGKLQTYVCMKLLTVLFLGLLELCPDKQLVSKYRRQQDVMDSLKLRIGFSSAVQVGVT